MSGREPGFYWVWSKGRAGRWPGDEREPGWQVAEYILGVSGGGPWHMCGDDRSYDEFDGLFYDYDGVAMVIGAKIVPPSVAEGHDAAYAI